MLHAEPFETHLLSSELCVLFIYFLKGNCIGLEYHIILSKIHIIVIIKTKIIDQNKSCSNNPFLDLKIRLIGDHPQDGRVYNTPTVSKVAAMIVGDIDPETTRDIIIHARN